MRSASPRARRRAWAAPLATLLLAAGVAHAAVRTTARMDVPPCGTIAVNEIRAGFVETLVADSLDSPVSMAIAPDGRIFVCEQRGTLRVVRGERLLSRPFVTLPTRAEIEEGLIGVALDPAFPAEPYVYVCWTALEPHRHHRVSRFTASGDTALAGSEVVLLELDDNGDHNLIGGALRFGRDGTLFVSTGENGIGPLAQSLGSTFGKILRVNRDGSIPADNPFLANTSGHHRAIWARGLRNAFSFDVDPASGRVFANDVGAGAVEEVNEIVAGGNYGWPLLEGPGNGPGFVPPVHHYGHDAGCAITGATFYSPRATTFPREWLGRYLFGEYCWNEIRWLAPPPPGAVADTAHVPAHGVFGVMMVPGPVDLRVAADGTLWYLARGNSSPVGGEGTAHGALVRVTHSPVDPPPDTARRR